MLAIDGKRIANLTHTQVVQLLTDAANGAYAVTLGAAAARNAAFSILYSRMWFSRHVR